MILLHSETLIFKIIRGRIHKNCGIIKLSSSYIASETFLKVPSAKYCADVILD